MNKLIKMFKKKSLLVILSIVILIVFVSLWNIVSGGYDKQNKIILMLKKIIPTSISQKIRDTIFIIPELKKRNSYLELVLRKNQQNYKGEIYSNTTVVSKINKHNYNLKEFFLPFPRLDLRLRWDSNENSLRRNYLEIIEDKILAISGEGETIYFNKSNINNKTLNQKIIKNNLSNIIEANKFTPMGIRGLFYDGKQIFISFFYQSQKGYSMDIYAADMNFEKLNFNLFFKSDEYWDNYTVRTGGRITQFTDSKILLSFGDCTKMQKAQDLNSLKGKIISIDKLTKKFEVLSLGHRNQQGLIYDSEKNIIINSEHGPNGGDEININRLNKKMVKNFGWPISSYGKNYDGTDPYKKSHKEFGYIEPLKNFSPSIGISEIQLKKNIDSNNNNYIFASSLRAGSIYKLKTNQSMTEVLDMDRIYFPEHRIRDMKYDKDTKSLFLIFETIPSIGVLKIS